jgi:hypothetical protein
MIVTRAVQLQPNKKGNTNNSETDSSKYLMRFSHFQTMLMAGQTQMPASCPATGKAGSAAPRGH